MQDLGLAGIQKKSFKPQATDSNHTLGYSPNLFKAQGMPEACDQVWVCDTTYLMTDNGWNYLATVMDLFSRRIVGWEVSEHNDGDLVRNALYKATQTRQGFLNEDLILHSDRGSTYAGKKHRDLIRRAGHQTEYEREGKLLRQCRHGVLLRTLQNLIGGSVCLCRFRGSQSQCI